MSRTRVIVAVIVGASLVVGAAACSDDESAVPSARTTTTTATSSEPTTTVVDGDAGSPGIGDPTTPFAGNGGYDVAHYRLEIDATRPNGEIVGTTTIDATATHALSSFDLDLAGFTVDDVTVDGADAPEGRFGPELRVTPGHAIAAGTTFTTVVRYHGVPEPVPDPTAPGSIGWLTGESGSFVVSEPVGAKGVFPSNDHPSDKATYTIVVTAPTTETVVANGVRTDRVDNGAAVTWTFDMPDPMATYLVQIAIGQYRIVEGTTPAGMPLRSVAPIARPAIDLTAANQRAADQITWFQTLFGPYPFDTYGILIADAPPTFALETQTISIFPTTWYLLGDLVPTETIEAHELSHQWFGDWVSLERWSDMWLNEGFATYGEWLWDEHTGGQSVDASVAEVMPEAPSLRQQYGAVAEPAPDDLFSPNEYEGAGIVLHALRKTIGDDKFFTTLRTWTERYGGKTATSADFEALAAEVSGQDLTAFFVEWLHSTTVPPMPA